MVFVALAILCFLAGCTWFGYHYTIHIPHNHAAIAKTENGELRTLTPGWNYVVPFMERLIWFVRSQDASEMIVDRDTAFVPTENEDMLTLKNATYWMKSGYTVTPMNMTIEYTYTISDHQRFGERDMYHLPESMTLVLLHRPEVVQDLNAAIFEKGKQMLQRTIGSDDVKTLTFSVCRRGALRTDDVSAKCGYMLDQLEDIERKAGISIHSVRFRFTLFDDESESTSSQRLMLGAPIESRPGTDIVVANTSWLDLFNPGPTPTRNHHTRPASTNVSRGLHLYMDPSTLAYIREHVPTITIEPVQNPEVMGTDLIDTLRDKKDRPYAIYLYPTTETESATIDAKRMYTISSQLSSHTRVRTRSAKTEVVTPIESVRRRQIDQANR